MTDALRGLLEGKHLYQSILLAEIPFPDIVNAFTMSQQQLAGITRNSWIVANPRMVVGPQPEDAGIQFIIPHVQMYCKTCERSRPFNPQTAAEPLAGSSTTYRHVRTNEGVMVQVFAVAFECQGCKGPHEVLLIHRDGYRLTLCGRAPIEHVEVSKAIPTEVAKFYSGAIVAHQCGQTLAALFLFRTCIEQWMRKWDTNEARTEDAMKKYLESLPDDFKQRFPSLPNIYSKISAALHTANAGAGLFDESAKDIVEHFDARRLFKLPGAKPQPSPV